MLLIMFNYCGSPAKLTTATPRNIVNTNKVKTALKKSETKLSRNCGWINSAAYANQWAFQITRIVPIRIVR